MGATENTNDTRGQNRLTVRDSARERQRAFIRGILAAHPGVTLSDIATRAEVSRSTITRFMNDPTVTTVLSVPIMEAIEGAFSSPGGGMAESEVSFVAPAGVEAADLLGPDRHTWRIGARFQGLEGYRIGDVITTDSAVTPVDGDDVLVQIEDMRGGATTHLRSFRRNWVFGGPGSNPELVDEIRVRIAGVVIKSTRERDG